MSVSLIAWLAATVMVGMAGFQKATKAQAKLRAAFFGPSGAGKTFTALRVATGLAGGKPIALIDTERGSASKYSDRFDFAVLELEDQTIDGYVAAIKMAASEGFAVLVIDSLSHAWQSLMDEVDMLAKSKYRGNTWSAWSEGTPKQRKLVAAILGFNGHIIATMRSKTEWTTVDDGRGKKAPQRIGLAPEQGKGVEYEFDLLVEISTEHIANVIKDRTGKFQDKLLDKPGEDFGRDLAAWLSEGTAPAPQPEGRGDDGLFDKAAAAIDAADSVRKIAPLSKRIDALVGDGTLSTEQWSALTDKVDAKLRELTAMESEAANA
jgi:hypothetical protein